MGLSSLFEHWPNSANVAWRMWANVIIAVGCHKWFDIYLIYWPPAIRCVTTGSQIRWTDLFWSGPTELCWQIAALRGFSLTLYVTLTLLSPGVTWCQATMQSNADTSYSDWDKYQQWVDKNTFLCRGDIRKQSRQTAGTRGTVCNAISESGSQEILHWPLFQGE